MRKRFIVFDRQDKPLFDLDGRIVSAVRDEKLTTSTSWTW